MAPKAPRAAWLGRRMWEEGQLLGGGNRPESRKVGPSLGSASGGQGWWAGRSVPFLHPSPALGSGPPSQPPQRPPLRSPALRRPNGLLGHQRSSGASLWGSLKHLVVFWRALISLEGLIFQTKWNRFIVNGSGLTPGSALTPGSRSVGKKKVVRDP